MSQSRKQKILGDVKRGRRTRTLATTAVVAIVMVSIIVALIVFTPHNSGQTNLIGNPISNTVYNQLTGVNDSTLVAVGHGQGVTPLTSESGPLLTSGGKPEVLYIGAEYCPYCAAERWALIVALSKFGNFSGLTYMLSADSPEVFPDTSTFSFRSLYPSLNIDARRSFSVEGWQNSPAIGHKKRDEQQYRFLYYEICAGRVE